VVKDWIDGDAAQPAPPADRRARNQEWTHLYAADVISMPDTWEYPWYAAWDLAFHVLALSLVDLDFAKQHGKPFSVPEWGVYPNRGSNGGGDSWLRSELHNPEFIQPYGYASPNRTEYRPFYGYGYPYAPSVPRRAVIEVRPYGY